MRENKGIPNIVTFTGVDDKTDIEYLEYLSKTYPNVEWCVHYHPEIQGSPGYPKRDWVRQLLEKDVSVSVQLSGQVIYEIVLSPSRGADFVLTLDRFSRVQLNIDYGNKFFTPNVIKNIYSIFYEFGTNIIIPLSPLMDEEVIEWIDQRDKLSLLHSVRATPFPNENRWSIPPVVKDISKYTIGFSGPFTSENIIFELFDICDICKNQNLDNFWINMGSNFYRSGRFDLFHAEDTLRKIYE